MEKQRNLKLPRIINHLRRLILLKNRKKNKDKSSKSKNQLDVKSYPPCSERKWDDNKKRRMVNGKFNSRELIILQNAICEYAKTNGLDEYELENLITSSEIKAHPRAWTDIARALPHRSVYACQKVAKRKFNPNNYKGKWTKDEEIRLVELVRLHGQKWTTVSNELNRTPENCRDKFRDVGGLNHQSRK